MWLFTFTSLYETWSDTQSCLSWVITGVFYCFSMRSGWALRARCAESPGGKCCPHFFFLISHQPGREVGVMHSSGRQEEWKQPVCRCSCPITTAPPLSRFCPLSSAISWPKTLVQATRKMRTGTTENDVLHISRPRALGRRQSVSLSLHVYCTPEVWRSEECPPAVSCKRNIQGRGRHVKIDE